MQYSAVGRVWRGGRGIIFRDSDLLLSGGWRVMMSDVYCGQGLDIDIAMAMCSFYLTLFIYVVMATTLF